MMTYYKYNLGYGLPPVHLIDNSEVLECYEQAINNEMPDKKSRLYDYGNLSGDEDVKKSLSQFYHSMTGCYINTKNILLTSGASSGILLSSLAFLKPNDNILVEFPSFFIMYSVFENLNLNLIPIQRHVNGFDQVELEETVRKYEIKAFYVTSAISNPIGVGLDLKNKRRIYDLANKYKFYVFSDDIYEFFYYDNSKRVVPQFFCSPKLDDFYNEDEKLLLSNNHKENQSDFLSNFNNDSSEFVISINSFNKTIFPNIKFGFIIAHSDVIHKLEYSSVNYATCGLKSINQFMVAAAINKKYIYKWIEIQVKYIKNNIEMACSLLSKCKFLSFHKPEGGYFIFLKLDDAVDEVKLNEEKAGFQFNFIQGSSTIPSHIRSENQGFSKYVRLSLSVLEFELAKEGIEKFIEFVEYCVRK